MWQIIIIIIKKVEAVKKIEAERCVTRHLYTVCSLSAVADPHRSWPFSKKNKKNHFLFTHFLTFPWQQQTLHTRGARGLQLKQGLSLREAAAEDGLRLLLFSLLPRPSFYILSIPCTPTVIAAQLRSLLMFLAYLNTYRLAVEAVLFFFFFFSPWTVCSQVHWAPQAHLPPSHSPKHIEYHLQVIAAVKLLKLPLSSYRWSAVDPNQPRSFLSSRVSHLTFLVPRAKRLGGGIKTLKWTTASASRVSLDWHASLMSPLKNK